MTDWPRTDQEGNDLEELVGRLRSVKDGKLAHLCALAARAIQDLRRAKAASRPEGGWRPPEGYTLVPLKPTEWMIRNGAHWEHHGKRGPSYAALRRAWPHMISAAPAPPND